jgi:Uma2 family endonuclease
LATTARRFTYDDLEAIPQEREGDRHEIIDGELIVTPSPIPHHQGVSANIVYALERIVREQNLGKVYTAPIDVRFTADYILIPDIVFISRDRLHVIGPKAVDASPDLVIEILSPGTRQRDLTVKRNLYARFGVPEYWVVDPIDRTVSVFERSGSDYQSVPHAANGSIQSRVLPGLELSVDMVFEGV